MLGQCGLIYGDFLELLLIVLAKVDAVIFHWYHSRLVLNSRLFINGAFSLVIVRECGGWIDGWIVYGVVCDLLEGGVE